MSNPMVPAAAEGLPDDDMLRKVSDLASMTFAGQPPENEPPTPDEWAAIGRGCLPYLRMVHSLMGKDKPQLVDLFHRQPDTMMNLAEGVMDARDWFTDWAERLAEAETRLLSAAATATAEQAGRPADAKDPHSPAQAEASPPPEVPAPLETSPPSPRRRDGTASCLAAIGAGALALAFRSLPALDTHYQRADLVAQEHFPAGSRGR